MVVGQIVKILVEAVSAFRGPEVLSVAPRVLMESVRLFGLEAMKVLGQACGGHEHSTEIAAALYTYRRESACQGSKCL
jgi:hypothetical protein